MADLFENPIFVSLLIITFSKNEVSVGFVSELRIDLFDYLAFFNTTNEDII